MVRLRAADDADTGCLTRWLNEPHVLEWFHEPDGWLDEFEKRGGEFAFISHCIAELDGVPFGYCQYYPYRDGAEDWYKSEDIEGVFSIDYMIGEPNYLKKGLGRQMIKALIEKIAALPGARRIVAQPEAGNAPSRAALLASGFEYEDESDVFIHEISVDEALAK